MCGLRTLLTSQQSKEKCQHYKLKDTSRDQRLVYHLGHALQSGVVPDWLATAVIGPMLHARWLTLAARILRKALSTRKPTKAFSRILFMILNLYLPAWFHIKNSPHCQSGALHFFYMLELSRDLCSKAQEVAHKVLQDNSYWAHPENIVRETVPSQTSDMGGKTLSVLAHKVLLP